MALAEASLWDTIRSGTTGHWARVENLIGSGTPDVSFAFLWGEMALEGWVELKVIQEWPKRAKTRVDPGVEIEQVKWWALRSRAGGEVWLCIGTPEGEILLLRGVSAARAAGKQFTRGELLEAAWWRGDPRCIEEGIASWKCG